MRKVLYHQNAFEIDYRLQQHNRTNELTCGWWQICFTTRIIIVECFEGFLFCSRATSTGSIKRVKFAASPTQCIALEWISNINIFPRRSYRSSRGTFSSTSNRKAKTDFSVSRVETERSVLHRPLTRSRDLYLTLAIVRIARVQTLFVRCCWNRVNNLIVIRSTGEKFTLCPNWRCYQSRANIWSNTVCRGCFQFVNIVKQFSVEI